TLGRRCRRRLCGDLLAPLRRERPTLPVAPSTVAGKTKAGSSRRGMRSGLVLIARAGCDERAPGGALAVESRPCQTLALLLDAELGCDSASSLTGLYREWLRPILELEDGLLEELALHLHRLCQAADPPPTQGHGPQELPEDGS